jgi:hypothetical protein
MAKNTGKGYRQGAIKSNERSCQHISPTFKERITKTIQRASDRK